MVHIPENSQNTLVPYSAYNSPVHTKSDDSFVTILTNSVGVPRPGVPGPTSECRRVPQPRWVEREGEREGGRARRPETGVREVGILRPSCSSRAQVGCACSRGLQASTRERERAAFGERLFSSSSPRGQPSLRGPWSSLL
jgi:hypothetical protein